MALSERQQQIYTFMTRFSQEKGRPPTIREIGRAVGISSTSVVNYNLNILERVGLIAREKQVSRGLRVVGANGKNRISENAFVQIPLLGRIVAGKPVPIPDPGTSGFEGESVTLTRDLVPDADNLYALHVKGESMVDASIHDGDIVVMRHQQVAQNGDLVAVWLKDEHATTLKRYYRESRKIRLQPANPTFKPIFKDPDEVEVQGKVVLVIRQLERVA